MNGTLALYTTEYNAVRILNRLAELVEEAGGAVAVTNDEVVVRTKGYDNALEGRRNERERLEREMIGLSPTTAWRKAALERRISILKKEEDVLKKERDEAPVVRTRFMDASLNYWIRFTLEGYEYNFLTEGTPFFPDRWSKKPEGSEDRVGMEAVPCGNKFYYPDEVFMPVAPRKTVEKAARGLFAFLKAQGVSRRYA